jgi:hypothetical protein
VAHSQQLLWDGYTKFAGTIKSPKHLGLADIYMESMVEMAYLRFFTHHEGDLTESNFSQFLQQLGLLPATRLLLHLSSLFVWLLAKATDSKPSLG